jgi:hypothetical protein
LGLYASLMPGHVVRYSVVVDPGVTPAVMIRQENDSALSFSLQENRAYAFRFQEGWIKNTNDN